MLNFAITALSWGLGERDSLRMKFFLKNELFKRCFQKHLGDLHFFFKKGPNLRGSTTKDSLKTQLWLRNVLFS
jgi:hypothetical protein